MNTLGIRQRIAQTTSEQEIDSLLVEGKKYVLVSSKTRRAWNSTANRRRAKLSGAPAPKAIVQEEVEVVDTPKKRKVKKKIID